MIVDLLRNDLSMVCEPGTVEVPALMQVESYPSRAPAGLHGARPAARRRRHRSTALRALFPAGSMTGAPKLRTMEIIDAVEATAAGVYAGAFGWLSADGRADLGVVIRSLVARRDGEARGATSSAPAAASPSAPTSTRSTPRPAGRPPGSARVLET